MIFDRVAVAVWTFAWHFIGRLLVIRKRQNKAEQSTDYPPYVQDWGLFGVLSAVGLAFSVVGDCPWAFAKKCIS